jgi:hypothetical protein
VGEAEATPLGRRRRIGVTNTASTAATQAATADSSNAAT